MTVNRGMRTIDAEGLAVVDTVKSCYTQLCSDYGPIGNICMVFMHDLVIHFSGILMQRTALEHYPDKVVFPCVDKHYALSPYEINPDSIEFEESDSSFKTRLRQWSPSWVTLGEALPVGYRQSLFSAKWINLMGGYKPFTRAFLPRRDEQIDSLCDLVIELCKIFEVEGAEMVCRNWEHYTKHHTCGNQSVLHQRALLLGTRNNLQNRKLAVNYLQQDKEVVAITHGEVGNSVMDEPPFGYSERTLCSTLIDYGVFDEDGIHNSPLIAPRRRFYRSAPAGSVIHLASADISLPKWHRFRALYIPTMYSGNGLYGPFHIYEDVEYRRWQRELFAVFPRLTFKAHPKSRSSPLSGIPVDKRQLEDCIRNYDLLVFDYFATGSMLALLSDKPVIYFDIGLRKLHTQFMQDLRNRCEYAKIDLQNPIRIQVECALNDCWARNVARSNTEVARYSLCSQTPFNWIELFQALNRGELPSW